MSVKVFSWRQPHVLLGRDQRVPVSVDRFGRMYLKRQELAYLKAAVRKYAT